MLSRHPRPVEDSDVDTTKERDVAAERAAPEPPHDIRVLLELPDLAPDLAPLLILPLDLGVDRDLDRLEVGRFLQEQGVVCELFAPAIRCGRLAEAVIWAKTVWRVPDRAGFFSMSCPLRAFWCTSITAVGTTPEKQ